MDQQNHPLHGTDRAHVDRLLAVETPADADLVDAARLLTRYADFPGAPDLRDDLAKVLRLWGLDLSQALTRPARKLAKASRPDWLARWDHPQPARCGQPSARQKRPLRVIVGCPHHPARRALHPGFFLTVY